jgi:hypothetical protein
MKSSKIIPMSEGSDTGFNICQQHPADFPGGWGRVFAGKMVAPKSTHLISGYFLHFQPMFDI